MTTTPHLAAVSRVGHALSDATRARVLLSLRDGPRRSGELAIEAGVSVQSMSNHLACLRGCHLVEATRDGRTVWYQLADPALSDVLLHMLNLTRSLEPTCCTGERCDCA